MGDGLSMTSNGHQKEPNLEMREKFMEMFEAYVNQSGIDKDEKERRRAMMTREEEIINKTPIHPTRQFPHSMGKRHPGEEHEEEDEKPLEEEHILHGHNKHRIPKNHKGGDLANENRNNIKYIKGNVHISHHLSKKIEKLKPVNLENSLGKPVISSLVGFCLYLSLIFGSLLSQLVFKI